jgi:hypothetical protein
MIENPQISLEKVNSLLQVVEETLDSDNHFFPPLDRQTSQLKHTLSRMAECDPDRMQNHSKGSLVKPQKFLKDFLIRNKPLICDPNRKVVLSFAVRLPFLRRFAKTAQSQGLGFEEAHRLALQRFIEGNQ